jgi:hypothetical protein
VALGQSKAYEIIHQIAPNKMHALCECLGLPVPEQLNKQETPWLYCLPWYVGDNDKWNPKDWVAKIYLDETYVTLDELPELRRPQQ